MFLFSNAQNYHGQPNVFIDDTGRALFEIDDSKSKFMLGEAALRDERRRTFTVGEMIDHPELFENYPHLRNKPVFLNSGRQPVDPHEVPGIAAYHLPTPRHKQELKHDGFYSLYEREKVSPATLHTHLLHEIQHDIQFKSHALSRAHARPTMAWADNEVANFVDDSRKLQETSESFEAASRKAGYKITTDHKARWKDFNTDAYPHNPRPGIHDPALPAGYVTHRQLNSELMAAKQMQSSAHAANHIKLASYYFDPSEVMAREVESRQHLSMQERLAIRPQLAATWPTEGPAFGPNSKPVSFFGNPTDAKLNLRHEERVIAEHAAAKTAAPAKPVTAAAPPPAQAPAKITAQPHHHPEPVAMAKADVRAINTFNSLAATPHVKSRSKLNIIATAATVSLAALGPIVAQLFTSDDDKKVTTTARSPSAQASSKTELKL